MPAKDEIDEKQTRTRHFIKYHYVPMSKKTHLNFLADIIPLLKVRASIGDILIFAGLGLVILTVIKERIVDPILKYFM